MFSEQQLENLKVLIRESGALSLAEQEEWLGLLPFMNDKQLQSLESMLAGYSGKAGIRQPVPVSVVEQVHETEKFELELPPPPAPPAELLLQQSNVASKQTDSEKKESLGPVKNSGAVTTVSDFLKQHYTPTYEPKKPDAPKPVGSLKQDFAKTDAKVVPEQITASEPNLPQAGSGRPEQVSEVKSFSRPAVKSQAENTILKTEKPVKNIQPASLSSEPQGKTAEPLSLKKVEQRADAVKTKKTEEQKEQDKEYIFETIVKVDRLEDVKNINVATLRGVGVVNLTQKIKSLCDKYGYFRVLFILEASPLYQIYLSCGLKALKEQIAYEDVEAELEKTGAPCITKPEFEAIADLLRKIRATS